MSPPALNVFVEGSAENWYGAGKIKFMDEHTTLKSAQDIQDDIFRKMSADKKLEVAAGLWLLAKALDPDKIDFRIHGGNRPAASSH